MAKDVYSFALNMIRQNPNIANSPAGQELQQILENRDDKAGEALANQLLQKSGMSREDGLAKARQFFGLE